MCDSGDGYNGAQTIADANAIKAAVAALTSADGASPKPFEIKLVQMVQLMKGGQPFKMSKRAGNFVTLADVVDMVGKDVVRFTMLTRKPDAQMDFDFDKVVEASKDNPVFYVQYAHARIHSTMRKAAAEGFAPSPEHVAQLGPEELGLVKLAAQFPRVVESAATAREPHRVAFFLYDLAAGFHAYWNVGNDRPAQGRAVDPAKCRRTNRGAGRGLGMDEQRPHLQCVAAAPRARPR